MARWATVKEAAEYMRIQEQTIRNAIHKKEPLGLLFHKPQGGRVVVDLDNIDSFVRCEK